MNESKIKCSWCGKIIDTDKELYRIVEDCSNTKHYFHTKECYPEYRRFMSERI